ncbi:MAG: PQQ-binding-like beta-propeller repeat protein [Verrucomicrobiaceae bacterium]|nr:PQQ-binding-like beta-propeller repeat protein [Verrucomicrobiaceae bacterium]
MNPCRLTFVAICLSAACPLSADWAYTRANPEMTGATSTELKLPLELEWQYKSMEQPKGQAEMLVTSAVVKNGKVYAGNKDGKFFCLDLATGKPVWTATANKASFDGAAGFSGDLVIAGSTDCFVYAWNATTGKETWKFETHGEVHAAVNVWTDPKSNKDYVYIGSHDNNLYCLTAADGKKVWEAPTGNYVNGGSAVADGKVVFGGCDAVLHIHDALTGKELRQIDVGNYIGNNVAIAAGIVYVTHYGGRVGAFDIQTGTKVWEYGERDFEYYAAVGIADKMVAAAGRDKRIHGIDRATGEGKWEYRTKDTIDSSPLICGGKVVLCGSSDGYVYALNLADGEELWKYEVGAAVRTSAAMAGDFILFGADDGVLYCFKNSQQTKSP